LEKLSFSASRGQYIPAALLNWAFLQFIALPNMSQHDRKEFMWLDFSPYLYAISGALILACVVGSLFLIRGRHSTHGRRIEAFGMALLVVWNVADYCGPRQLAYIAHATEFRYG